MPWLWGPHMPHPHHPLTHLLQGQVRVGTPLAAAASRARDRGLGLGPPLARCVRRGACSLVGCGLALGSWRIAPKVAHSGGRQTSGRPSVSPSPSPSPALARLLHWQVHTAVLTVGGRVYVWGDNGHGVLGNGGSWSEDLPRLLGCSDAVGALGSSEAMGAGLSGEYVTALAASGWHTLAVTSGSFLGFDLASALPAGFGMLFGADVGLVRLPGCHPAFNRFRALAGDAPGAVE
jgi:hypothetical protein